MRADLNQPDLPFYYVQIGRFINGGDPKGWNAVQEVQRRLPERVPNTAVVSVIDLELDDLIHVGTHGLKRTGERLARIAERELFGQIGATTPTLDRVSRGSNNTLIVKFKGVNMRIAMGAMAAGMGMGRMGSMGGGMGGMGGAMGGGMGSMRGWRRGRSDVVLDGHRSKQSRRAERAGAEARAAHWRILDPQGGRHADCLDLRGGRGQGPRHRGLETDGQGPRRRPFSGTGTARTLIAT